MGEGRLSDEKHESTRLPEDIKGSLPDRVLDVGVPKKIMTFLEIFYYKSSDLGVELRLGVFLGEKEGNTLGGPIPRSVKKVLHHPYLISS